MSTMMSTPRFTAAFVGVMLLLFAAGCGGGKKSSSSTATYSGSLTTSDRSFSDGSYYDLWSGVATRSGTVTVATRSSNIDTSLIVIDSAGDVVAENDDRAESDTNSFVSFNAVSGQTYYISVSSYSAADLGSYTIETTNLRDVFINDSRSVPVGLSKLVHHSGQTKK